MKTSDDFFIQVSVYLENKIGSLKKVSGILQEQNIDIKTLSLAEAEDYGVLRMIVDKPEETVAALTVNSIQARTTEVIAVEVKDRPGGMDKVLDVLSKSNINVEYLYASVERKGDKAIIIFKVDNNKEAIKVLKANCIDVAKKSSILTNS